MSRRLVTILLIYAGIILLYAAIRPQVIDWRQSFRNADKIPFGTYILYREARDVLRPSSFTTSEVPFFNLETDTTQMEGVFIAMNRLFFADELDTDKLLEYVASGNTAFLSAEEFPEYLLDTLDLQLTYEYRYTQHMTDWIYEPNLTVGLSCLPDTSWKVATRSWFRYFNLDSVASDIAVTTLGTIEEYAGFIRYPFGHGAFYLHSFPQAFTNYYMLAGANHAYAAAVLSHLPEASTVIWDEYYKGQPGLPRNLLGVLVRHSGFRWAYWLIISGCALFVLFTAKRKQRTIPVILPPQNSSIRFIRTLGDLYFQRGDHTDLAAKKLLYFKDYLRNTYLLDLMALDAGEAQRVARRTGKDPSSIIALFQAFSAATAEGQVTARQLTTLQHELDHFFERKPHGESSRI